MKMKAPLLPCAGLALLALAFNPLAPAQTAAPARSRVTVTHVKPDMLSEWIDLQKNEVVPALKKSGEKTRTVYATSVFGNSYEYLLISPIVSMAQFDGQSPLVKALDQPGATRLNEKLRKCVESSNSYMIMRVLDASNILSEAMPNMLVTARYRIAAGRMFRCLVHATSITTRSVRSGSATCMALVRSMTTTRGSLRSFQSSTP